ncbi:hypothetical protein ACQWKP_23775, partial [Salmonella enterica subsp. enterica serovar Infantis]
MKFISYEGKIRGLLSFREQIDLFRSQRERLLLSGQNTISKNETPTAATKSARRQAKRRVNPERIRFSDCLL